MAIISVTLGARPPIDEDWVLKKAEAEERKMVLEQSKGRGRQWKRWQECLRALFAGECIELK